MFLVLSHSVMNCMNHINGVGLNGLDLRLWNCYICNSPFKKKKTVPAVRYLFLFFLEQSFYLYPEKDKEFYWQDISVYSILTTDWIIFQML